jgi:diaminopimelate decarboxylase
MLEMVIARMRALHKLARENGALLMFAVKSFPHQAVLRAAWSELSGFDLSNEKEFSAVLQAHQEAGFQHRRFLWFTDPQFSWSAQTLTNTAQAEEAVFTVQAHGDVEKLQTLVAASPTSSIKFAIRLNSNLLLNPSSPPSRFGLPPDAAALSALIKDTPIPFAGFHVHHGSESNSISDYVHMAHRLAALMKQMHLYESQVR